MAASTPGRRRTCCSSCRSCLTYSARGSCFLSAQPLARTTCCAQCHRPLLPPMPGRTTKLSIRSALCWETRGRGVGPRTRLGIAASARGKAGLTPSPSFRTAGPSLPRNASAPWMRQRGNFSQCLPWLGGLARGRPGTRARGKAPGFLESFATPPHPRPCSAALTVRPAGGRLALRHARRPGRGPDSGGHAACPLATAAVAAPADVPTMW